MEFPNPANHIIETPILRIPPELRLQIYDLAIGYHWDTYPRIYSGFFDGLPEPPLLRVCRTFRLEGAKPYFAFLKDKEAGLLKTTMHIQGKEINLRELAKKFDEDGEEIGWLVMNRLWIEKDLLPDVQKELKRLERFALSLDGHHSSDNAASSFDHSKVLHATLCTHARGIKAEPSQQIPWVALPSQPIPSSFAACNL